MRIIDVHTHVIPKAFFDMIDEGILQGIAAEKKDGKYFRIVFADSSAHPLSDLFLSASARLEFMQEKGIDCQVISISPRLFFYDLPEDEATEVCKRFNDELLTIQENYSGRQIAMGTLPMQFPDLAVKELERIYKNGMRSAQIGTFVNGRNLSEEEFWPVFAAAERLSISIMVHPLITNEIMQMKKYHISNLVGNPWQTTVAIENMIFSGLFERFPALKILLVHGGGFLPYQMGRMVHGYKVRAEAKKEIPHNPDTYVKRNIFFDGLTHSEESLAFLLQFAGSEKVMFGTDFPYDMAEYDQLGKAVKAGLKEDELEAFTCKNAELWLRERQ